MKIKISGLLLVSVGLGVLSSCSNQYKSQITVELKNAAVANAKATSHIEWEMSENNSIKIFERLRDGYSKVPTEMKQKYQDSVCEGLSELSLVNLMIFDDEINKPINKDVIGSYCQKTLLKRINRTVEEQTTQFEYLINLENDLLTKPIDFQMKTKTVELSEVMTTKEMISSLNDGEFVLTFDDGPDPVSTELVLKTLKSAGDVKAMFFTNGSKIVLSPSKIVAEHENKHVVGNHSWSHYCLSDTESCFKNNNIINKDKNEFEGPGYLSDQAVLEQIIPNFEIIQTTIGEAAPFFRYPFGSTRPSTSEYLKEHGIYEVNWNVDSDDWKKIQSLGLNYKVPDQETEKAEKQLIPFTAQDVVDSVVRQVKAKKKGIILFHDIHIRTATLLPQVLFELNKLNITIVQFKAMPLDTLSLSETK